MIQIVCLAIKAELTLPLASTNNHSFCPQCTPCKATVFCSPSGIEPMICVPLDKPMTSILKLPIHNYWPWCRWCHWLRLLSNLAFGHIQGQLLVFQSLKSYHSVVMCNRTLLYTYNYGKTCLSAKGFYCKTWGVRIGINQQLIFSTFPHHSFRDPQVVRL